MCVADQRPLRVHVFGNSASILVAGLKHGAGADPSRPYETYTSALGKATSNGRTFDVVNMSVPFGMITDVSGCWLRPLAQVRPDVVILQYGEGESYPKIFPKFLVRHLQGHARHQTWARRRYWDAADRALLAMFNLEGRLDRYLPVAWSRVSPQRFEQELFGVSRRVVEQIGSRLVLTTAWPPIAPLPFANPTLDRRVNACNEAVRRVASRVGADIFPMAEIVQSMGPSVLGDGIHLTRAGHLEVARRLAEFLTEPAHVARGKPDA